MNKKRMYQIAIMALLIAAWSAACATATPGPVKLNVNLMEFSFEPASVSVPAGSQVNLTLTNSGTLEHEWVIINLNDKASPPFNDDDEPKVYWEHELEPGESETVTFTAPSEPGEYEIVCGTPGHLENGMQGTLVVTAP